MKIVVYFISILTLTFVLTACPKTVFKHIYPTSLTENDKAVFPYKENDTIQFQDSTGKTLSYLVGIDIDTVSDNLYLEDHYSKIKNIYFEYQYKVLFTNLNSTTQERMELVFSKGSLNSYMFKKSDVLINGTNNFIENQLNLIYQHRILNSVEYDSVYVFDIRYYPKNNFDTSVVLIDVDSVYFRKKLGIIGWKSKKNGNWFRK